MLARTTQRGKGEDAVLGKGQGAGQKRGKKKNDGGTGQEGGTWKTKKGGKK